MILDVVKPLGSLWDGVNIAGNRYDIIEVESVVSLWWFEDCSSIVPSHSGGRLSDRDHIWT